MRNRIRFLVDNDDPPVALKSAVSSLAIAIFPIRCSLTRTHSNTGSIIFTDMDRGMPGSGSLAMKKVAATYPKK